MSIRPQLNTRPQVDTELRCQADTQALVAHRVTGEPSSPRRIPKPQLRLQVNTRLDMGIRTQVGIRPKEYT